MPQVPYTGIRPSDSKIVLGVVFFIVLHAGQICSYMLANPELSNRASMFNTMLVPQDAFGQK